MTRAISFSFIGWLIAKIGEIGEATRRWEKIQKVRVEAKALEGIEFRALPKGNETLQLPFGNLFFGPEIEDTMKIPANLLLKGSEEFGKELSSEQMAFLDLIGREAEMVGFDIELKKLIFHDQREPVIHMLLKPAKTFHELIGQGFEDQKALPPVSEFKTLFDLFQDESNLVAIKSRDRGN